MTTCMPLFRFCFLILLGLFVPMLGLAASSPEQSSVDQGYTPPEICAGCHENQTEKWHDSDHAWAMKPANDRSILADFDNTVFDDGAAKAEFSRRGDEFWVFIEGENGVEEFRIAYTFGYFPLQQYLVELSRGRLQALTIAWDSRPEKEGGQRWFSMYPGEAFAPDDALHWTGRYQNWNAMCADCHSTALTMNYDPESDSFATTWQERNVGCQGCHGPGEEHVVWAKEGALSQEKEFDASYTGLSVDFEQMNSEELVETCAYCHSRRQSLKDGQHANERYLDKALPTTLRPDLYHSDGQILGEVYVYGSFVQSKMFDAGVSCLDCHDAHTTELVAEGNAICTQCHNTKPPARFPGIQSANYDSPEHHHHPVESAGAECVNCHMPEKTYMVVDPRRDHSFRIPRPDLTQETGSPNVCTDCHSSQTAKWAKSTINAWYPDSEKPEHFGTVLSAFRRSEDDAFLELASLIMDTSRPEIARATAAEHLGEFGEQSLSRLRSGILADDPLVRAYSAGAAAQLPAKDNIGLLTSLLSADQPLAVRDQALNALNGTPLEQLPKKERASVQALREDYEKRLRDLAALPGTRFNLATHLQTQGRHSEAIDHYQSALALDPTFTPARVNLATLANEQGKIELAIQTLNTGAELRTIPDADRGHLAYLLALVLVENGRSLEALIHFKHATGLTPEAPRISYNYSLVLAKLNRLQQAADILQRALQQHPSDYSLLDAMIYVQLEQRNFSEALDYAHKMQLAYPENSRVEQLVQKLQSQIR